MSETDHAAAFAALSDQTRVDILRALWEADDHRASFSTLRRAAGVADSGKFNYHLGELTDEFVTKTEEGDYRLRRAGVDVVGSLIAGTYADATQLGPVPYDEPCPICGGETVVAYDGEQATVSCDDDERPEESILSVPAPPSVFTADEPDQLPDTTREYARSVVEDVRSGFCVFCQSPTDRSVVSFRAFTEASDESVRSNPLLQADCPTCGESVSIDLGIALTDHPAVVAFYDDHGFDVRRLPLMDTLSSGDSRSTVLDTDPVRARVRYTLPNAARSENGESGHSEDSQSENGESVLELTVGADVTVLNVTHTTVDPDDRPCATPDDQSY